MKRYSLSYRLLWLIGVLISQANFIVADKLNPQSDDATQAGLAESITSYQQDVSIDFFIVENLPAAATSIHKDVNQYKPYMAIPHDLPVPASHQVKEVVGRYDNVSDYAPRALKDSPAPSASFQALPDNFRVIPPDTEGSVGVNHVMTMLNDRVRIQTKTGTILSTVSLASFWNNSSAFDPQLKYDPYNNRWIAAVAVGFGQPSSGLLVAVSQTSDPTGVWYRYYIKGDPNSQLTVDFPRLGFNKDWVVVQANMFNNNGSFNFSKVFVLNKAQVYAGSLGNVRVFDLSGTGGTQTPAVTYDNSSPVLYFLQNWNGASSNGIGYLRLYVMEGAVGSETIRTVGYPSINQRWSSFGPFMNGGFGPQLGSTVRIDAGDARISKVVYRNGSVWASHSAFLPYNSPVRSGIQWWQIDPINVVTRQFGRIEDVAANLNSGNHFAYPSLAVNMRNDVLVGYSQFNPTRYASAAYSFRLGTDPVNTMQASNILKAGLAVYTKDFGGSRVRWGDYSNTVADPNGLDLWTIQEYAEALVNGQSAWGTWWGKIGLVTDPCQ